MFVPPVYTVPFVALAQHDMGHIVLPDTHAMREIPEVVPMPVICVPVSVTVV